MSLKDTYKQMKDLLVNISLDLEKADGGNKAAAQRVRTGTVRLEKVAKLYRKESIIAEKKSRDQKKTSAKPAKKAAAHAAPAKKAAAHAAPAKKAPVSKAKPAAKPVVKAKTSKATVSPARLSLKRATAKIPTRK